MRRALHHSLASTTLAAALALTACTGGEQATFEEPAPRAQAPDEEASDEEAPDEEAPDDGGDTTPESTSAPTEGTAYQAGLTPVEWPDAPRELSDVEREFMYEPGPFAGDAYDEGQVIEAVLAMEPGTAQEWQMAIRSQIQGDYAEDLKAAITFDPSIGDTSEGPTEGTAPEEVAVGTNHFALVLDASGSMDEESGSGTRMAEAKEALTGFVDSLPEDSTISLRVYGHEGDNTDAGKDTSCASSEAVYTGPVDAEGFGPALDAVEPTGWTPLARAIGDAAGDIPENATDGIVYVVTDGIETCGGDPVDAAEELAGSGIEPIVNVIGFQAGDADQEALRAIATAGGGEYTQADSLAELEQYWEAEYSRMMAAWGDWKSAELARIDDEGRERMDSADQVGTRLMRGADEEGVRGMDIAGALEAEDHLDYTTKNEVWGYFYDRKNDMWGYAYDLKNANWGAAYDIKNDAWSEVYETGNTKWSEYYSKSVADR